MVTCRVLSTTGDVALEILRLTAAAVDVFPPLRDAAGVALRIADVVKRFRSNKDQWRDLGEYVRDATASVVQSLTQVDVLGGEIGINLETLKNTLNQTAARIESEQTLPWHRRAARCLNDPQIIADMRQKVEDDIGLFQMSTTITTMVNVGKILDAVVTNWKTLSIIVQDTAATMTEAISISRNAALDRLPRIHGASWDPSRGCMKNTRVELVDDIMGWVEPHIQPNRASQTGGAQILLLTAVAGAGKSTIAQTVARICYEKKLLGSSFFFDRETEGRNTPKMLFTTVAADLSSRDPGLSECISAAIEQDRSLPMAPLSRQFEELILIPLRNCPIIRPTVVLIDALDEAWSEDLLDILRDRTSELPGAIRIILTSRMRPELGSLLRQSHVIGMELNVGAQFNLDDIGIYAPYRLLQLAKKRGLGEDWPGDQLRTDFASRADGLFLWVATVCDFLYGRDDPTQELRKLVSSTGLSGNSAEDQMNRLYATILESFDWDDPNFTASYHRVMGTAIATKTPLTIAAMNSLYRTPSLASDFTLQRLSPLLTGMREQDHGSQPVRVLHQSLRDFLVTQTAGISDSAQYKIAEAEHNQKLGGLCLDLMNRELSPMTPGTGFLAEDEEVNPGVPKLSVGAVDEALQYACLFWQHHLDGTDWSKEIQDALGRFVDQKTVLWTEVVTVFGKYYGLNKLRKWMQRAYCSGGINDVQLLIYNKDFAVASQGLYYRLQYEDRLEEALEASKEAVLAYRHLATSEPSAYTPELVKSLDPLSNCQSSLGYHTEALATGEEAVQLLRQLALDQPSSFKYEFAKALHTLSNRLVNMGRLEEALASAEEAVQLRRRLAKDEPALFAPDLALSLNVLSNRLSDFGHREEALATIEEAVQQYRQLAADRPSTYTPDLALCLNNLPPRLSDFGRYEEALVVAEEVVKLYQQLAADRPAAFRSDLARSFNNLCACLSDFGRHEEALAAIKKAVQLRRQLVADRPAAFTSDLAISLYNLARNLSSLGFHEEALEPVQEAIELYRKLAAGRPAVFASNLANSLGNLSYYQYKLGCYEESLVNIREATPLHRRLAAERPLVFNASLKLCLQIYSKVLTCTGCLEEAAVVDAELASLPN